MGYVVFTVQVLSVIWLSQLRIACKRVLQYRLPGFDWWGLAQGSSERSPKLLATTAGLLCLLSYGVAACLLGLRGRPSWPNRLLVVALVSTSVWAGLFMASGFDWDIPATLVLVSRVGRDAAWYAVLLSLLRGAVDKTLWGRLTIAAVAATALEAVFAVWQLSIDTSLGLRLSLPAIEFAASVYGLVLIENLMRNSPAQRVWSLKLMAIGLGAAYGYDITLRVPELLGSAGLESVAAAQPLAYIIVLPLFIVTAIRNES